MTHAAGNNTAPGSPSGDHVAAAALVAHYDAVAKPDTPEKHEPTLVASGDADTAGGDADGDPDGDPSAAPSLSAHDVAQSEPDAEPDAEPDTVPDTEPDPNAKTLTGPNGDDAHLSAQDAPPPEYPSDAAIAAAAAAPSDAGVQYAPPPPPPTDPAPRVRRSGTERYHASMEQLKHLVAAFDDNPCPSVATLNYLSETIDMPMHNLVLWFKNRRARSKTTPRRAPGQRRSYVKSGIYSRARRAPPPSVSQSMPPAHAPAAPPQHPDATSAAAPPPQQPADDSLPDQLAEPPVEDAQHAMLVAAAASEPSPRFEGMLAPPLEDAKRAPLPGAVLSAQQPAKRARVDAGESPVPDAGPGCRGWSSLQCLNAFIAFFDRTTGGLNPEQAKAAANVATQFFLGEMQSGLTVSSVAQPLHVSFEVLDQLIAKRVVQGAQPLSSGSRAVLGEFIAQIRSGEAAAYEQPEQNAPQPADSAAGVIANAAEVDAMEKVTEGS